jgi:hypothetical protein
MRIKKKQIREKLDTAELQQNANKIVDVAGNVKSQFKGLGMSDDEAAGAVADMMNISSDDVNEVNQEVMDKFEDQYGDKKGEDIYYATANKQDRDPETFELDEIGDDYEDIPTGQDIEVGADNYEKYQRMLRALGDEAKPEGGINYGDSTQGDATPDLPFESVNPKMTKNQLMETVLGKKQRRVIKTIKVKDLK